MPQLHNDCECIFDSTQAAFKATCVRCEAPLEFRQEMPGDDAVSWDAHCCSMDYVLIPRTWKLEWEPAWNMGPRD